MEGRSKGHYRKKSCVEIENQPCDWVKEATEKANGCSTIDELSQSVASFQGFEMKRTVFYTGNKNAKIIFVGKAPEIEDDYHQGNCGPAKQLLYEHLNRAGFDQSTILITNTVFWNTPDNRYPSDQEINMCKPFIEKLIALVSPKVLVMLGTFARNNILQVYNAIYQFKPPYNHPYKNNYLQSTIPAYIIYNPVYILDNQVKRTDQNLEDFRMIRAKLDEMPPSLIDVMDKTEQLDQLKQEAASIENCTLKTPDTNFVFSDGNPNGRIMFIGEAPSDKANREGIPFCGPTGYFLYDALKKIGLEPSDVFVTNSVFWRPSYDRNPEPEELEACKPFVEKLIALVSPQILVFVGTIALENFNNAKRGIKNWRGKLFQYNNQYLSEPIVASAILHPAYILRQPEDPEPLFHESLKTIREQYKLMESM